jgi:purine-binding chemotaxis protein CheW
VLDTAPVCLYHYIEPSEGLGKGGIMRKTDLLLVFCISGQCCALPLKCIERIIRAVEICPLPKAPEIVAGLINVQGQAISVLNIRKLFRLPEIETNLSDQIIIAHTLKRMVAIPVNDVSGVSEYEEQDFISSEELFPGIEYLEGVAKLKEGIVYIYDLERFLSLNEMAVIDPLPHTDDKISEVGSHGA